MRSTRMFLHRALLVAIAGSAAGAVLFACVLSDFTVASGDPETGTGIETGSVDSATPPGQDTGTNQDGSVTPDADTDGGGPKTHCDSVFAPPNATNFLCADFDSPLIGKGWDILTRTDGGTAEKTTDVATSLPTSLSTTASGTGAEGTLTWKRTAAMAFTQATAIFHINPGVLGGVAPPSNGTLELMEVTTNNASVTFGYSRGSTEFDGTPYYGYFIYNAAFGGAAAITRHKIPTALVTNAWTEVKIVWTADGKFNVFYNNINVLGVNGFATTDTSVKFRLGAYANFGATVMPVHRFDDIELSIRR